MDVPLPFHLKVAHPALGGLLDGTYLFMSSEPFDPPIPMDGPPWALRHVMSVAVRGGHPSGCSPPYPTYGVPVY